jgi:autoinducer 2 (AI-2) kinase
LLTDWGLSAASIVIVGGADTQLALKSTQPSLGDIAVVSGTTTPIVMVSERFLTDPLQRTWSNRHVVADQFILEANAGVTGLNYQRLKEIFYPNESYEVIAEELRALEKVLDKTDRQWPAPVTASLGSLIARERYPLTTGGFSFQVPVSGTLSRAQFIWAALWDIACCIKENLEVLCEVVPYEKDYIWGCSGGMQSTLLRQFVATLTGKEIWLRSRHTQASVIGGAIICGEVMGNRDFEDTQIEKTLPLEDIRYQEYYGQWKKVRQKMQAAYMKDK